MSAFNVSVNKRLDEWVSVERLDTRKVQYPRRDGQPGTGVNTPKKTSTYNTKFSFSYSLCAKYIPKPNVNLCSYPWN